MSQRNRNVVSSPKGVGQGLIERIDKTKVRKRGRSKSVDRNYVPKGTNEVKETEPTQAKRKLFSKNNVVDTRVVSLKEKIDEIGTKQNVSADEDIDCEDQDDELRQAAEPTDDFIDVNIDGVQDEFNTDDEGDNLLNMSFNEGEDHEEETNVSHVTEKVDSEVNFRIRIPRPESFMTLQNTVPNQPNFYQQANKPQQGHEMEEYIQDIIDKRWKAKEKEMEEKFLAKYGAKTNSKATKATGGKPGIERDEELEFNSVNIIDEGLISNMNRNANTSRVKSPSDTTVYSPALKRTPERINQDIDRTLIDKISEFVESVRFSGKGDGATPRSRSIREQPIPGTSTSTQHARKPIPEQPDARTVANERIVNHEKYKTMLVAPKGNKQYYLEKPKEFAGVMNESGNLMEDDEFFHITCHVDPVLRAKIERGEFVELEKLLPRDQFCNRAEEGKLEFYNKDGHTFLAPANKEGKITNVRRWEQAFRVYATIYSKAQPHRAAEIWQYVYVINTAASSYTWENVSFYNYTFRQMMSVNPQRNWSKIFNQMWNLTMRDPIQRNSQHGYNGKFVNNQGGAQNGGKRRKKNDSCWKFNRNEPCNVASCDFEHKCSYCGNYNHSVIDCPKLRDKMGGSNRNHNNHNKFSHNHKGKPGGNGSSGSTSQTNSHAEK